MRPAHLKYPLLFGAFACLAIGGGVGGVVAQEEQGDVEVAAIVRIDGPIDDVTERTLELRIKRAVEDAPRFLILSIDSAGLGGHIPAHTIAHNIEQLNENTDITTIAFVRGEALRGATVVAFGCKRLAMSPGSHLGSPDVGESDESTEVMRLDIEAQAKARTYPVDVAAAMVEPSIELHRLTWRAPNGRLETAWLSLEALEEKPASWRGNLLSDDIVCEPGQLLYINDDQAADIGLCSLFAADEDELCRQLAAEFSIGKVAPKRVDSLWWTEVVRFITWWPVKVCLFAIGAIALIVAMGQPGTGVPEIVFVVCFALVFFGSYLVGLTDWVEVILLIAGVILLAIEIFITPGFGVMGGLGVLCLVAALLLSFQKFVVPSNAIEWGLLVENAGKAVVGCGIGVVLLGAAIRFLPSTKIIPGLMHEHTQEALSLETPEHTAAPVGTTCVATTALRPVGKVTVDRNTYDAVAEDGLVDVGTTVVVVGHRGHELVVSSRPEAKTIKPPEETT